MKRIISSPYTPVVLLVLLSIVPCIHTICYSFLSDWDDNQYVLENPFIQKLSVHSIKQIFNPFGDRSFLGDEYLPVRDVVYSFTYLFWGKNPCGYRLNNILFHSAVVLLIYFIIYRLVSCRLISFWIAALFAVHPAHIESILWISSLKDVLSSFFFFLTVLLFILVKQEFRFRRCLYCLSIVCYIAACLSKSNAIVLPVILILLDIYFIPSQKRVYSVYIPYLFILGLFLSLAIFVGRKHGVVRSYIGGSFYITFMTMTWVMVEYVKLLIFPINQQIPHPYSFNTPYLWVTQWYDIRFISGILFFLPLGILALQNLYKNILHSHSSPSLHIQDLLSFFCLFFFCTMAPFSNIIIPIPEILAERYLYIPSLAVILVFGLVGYGMFKSTIKLARFSPVAIFAFFLILFILRSLDWKDSETLWKATIKNNPANTKGYYKLAWLYSLGVDKGVYRPNLGESKEVLTKRSIQLLEKAIELDPNYDSAHNNLAFLYLSLGYFEKAAYHITVAYKTHPEQEDFRSNLQYIYDQWAVALLKKRDMKSALEIYSEGLSLDPKNPFFKQRIKQLIGEIKRH